MTKRCRATPLAPEDRRRAIIDAVVPLLVEHGAGVTTKQIAQAAGIAEGTIFRVFPDKRALLLAVAAETINPEGGREELAARMRDLPDLRDKVVAVTEQMLARLERGMLAMIAIRTLLLRWETQTEALSGPPQAILDSNQALLDDLAEEVFAPHAAELNVAPLRAALILRSLTFGTWHPSTPGVARLTPDEIADACLLGVSTTPTTESER